jgi:hypothetical protein
MGQWDGTTEQDSGMGHFKQGPRTMGHEMGHGTFGELGAHGTAQWAIGQDGPRWDIPRKIDLLG